MLGFPKKYVIVYLMINELIFLLVDLGRIFGRPSLFKLSFHNIEHLGKVLFFFISFCNENVNRKSVIQVPV